MQAGIESESQKPSFPDDTSKVMPALTAFAAPTAYAVFALSQTELYLPPPKLVLIARIGLFGSSFLCVMHQFHAVTISASVAFAPEPAVIFSAYSFAPGAPPPM